MVIIHIDTNNIDKKRDEILQWELRKNVMKQNLLGCDLRLTPCAIYYVCKK